MITALILRWDYGLLSQPPSCSHALVNRQKCQFKTVIEVILKLNLRSWRSYLKPEYFVKPLNLKQGFLQKFCEILWNSVKFGTACLLFISINLESHICEGSFQSNKNMRHLNFIRKFHSQPQTGAPVWGCEWNLRIKFKWRIFLLLWKDPSQIWDSRFMLINNKHAVPNFTEFHRISQNFWRNPCFKLSGFTKYSGFR